MSVILHPAGPRPPRVYWTRRLVILGGLVLLVVVVWSMFSGDGGAGADDAGEATPPVEVEEGTPTCAGADLALVVTSAERSWAAGELPQFSISIANQGSSDCAVDAGEFSREILITSGSDPIWSSLDCAEPDGADAERVLLLAAGGAPDVTDYTWSRIRSDPSCTAGLAAPLPGTYHVTVELAGAQSEDAVFDLG